MPIFEVEHEGTVYEVEADSMEQAAGAFKPMEPVQPEPEPGYFSQMASNFLPSLGNVASDALATITNPIDTAAGLGQVAIGGIQNIRDAIPKPIQQYGSALPGVGVANLISGISDNLGGDFRPQADAAGQHYKDRYGGVDETLETIKTDPAGAALDVLGLFGTAAPAQAAKLNPLTRAASAVMQKSGKNIMGSATKLSKTIPTADADSMITTMLDNGISPNPKGVQRLKELTNRQARAVDNLIEKAEVTGGRISIDEVLDGLDDLKQNRGDSLVSGGADLDAIDAFKNEVLENAQRLDMDTLGAADLQKLKRDLYDRIAWNAKRQIDLPPVVEDAQVAAARAARKEIENMVPSVAKANKQLGQSLELMPHLERASRRIDDRQGFGMTDMFSVASGGLVGQMTGSVPLGIGAGAALELLNNPKYSPATARLIYSAGRGLATPASQVGLSLPYFAGSLYYKGEEDAAAEDEASSLLFD